MRIERTPSATENTPSLASWTPLTFRHLLVGALREFLDGEGIPGEAAGVLAELVVTLSRYREEGARLSPTVFMCESAAALVAHVKGSEPIVVGSGPLTPATVRRALKLCAPLAVSGWCLFLERGAETRFGIFHSDEFVLEPRPMDVLRATHDQSLHIAALAQLADNVIELRGSSGEGRYIYLSGARTDPPAPLVVEPLIAAATTDVAAEARHDVQTLYRRVFLEVFRSGHGTLATVARPGASTAALFVDGVFLSPPLDIQGLVRALRAGETADKRGAVQAAARLLQAMLTADGITVLRPDGVVAAYNIFVHHLPAIGGDGAEHQNLGGARQRTFAALAAEVGEDITAAFLYSQDGHAACRT